jgi:hypothetical protein
MREVIIFQRLSTHECPAGVGGGKRGNLSANTRRTLQRPVAQAEGGAFGDDINHAAGPVGDAVEERLARSAWQRRKRALRQVAQREQRKKTGTLVR